MSEATTPDGGAGSIVSSLSKKAISRSRMKDSFGHNMTKFPIAASGLGVLGMILFGATVAPIAVVGGGLVVGLGSWFYQYVIRAPENTRAYIRRVKDRIKSAEERKRSEVEPLLRESQRRNPEASKLIDSALTQFRHVGESSASFMDVLGRKLDSNEFTFGVYAAPAEQAAFGVYDNLEQIVTILSAIGSINVGELQQRVRELEELTNRSERENGVLEQLKERLKLHSDEIVHIEQLILENAQAITALEKVTTAITKMRNRDRQQTYGHEMVLQELLKIAERSSSLSDRK
mgnify:CR=1 FL=1